VPSPDAPPDDGENEDGSSDERRLERRIGSVLAEEGLDTTGIEVSADRGDITLNGTINSQSGKGLAERLLSEVDGVRQIRNNLRVRDT
jgi:osmotically-inducible protein OsmY